MKKNRIINALGIDIGGTNIKFVIINNSGEIIDFLEIESKAEVGRKFILGNIITGIEKILSKNKKIKIEGVGVGTPGLVNEEGKVVTGASNLKGWNGTPIKKILEKKLNIPVYVDNDVTALALGEAYFGAGRGYKNVICLALGTGLGGGIIIDKKIYRGRFGYAGEFGHIVVNPNGPRCTCGKIGCLETYASSWGLKRMAIKFFENNKDSLIYKSVKNNLNEITPKIIFDAYSKNDKIAIEILNIMGNYLGMGIGILVNIFDPDVIIIAGGIAKAGKVLIDLIYKYIYKYTLNFFEGKVKLKISKFKNKAGAIGSASLFFERKRIF